MEKTLYALLILPLLMLLPLLWSAQQEEKSIERMANYAMSTQEDAVGIYPNEMTDKISDFFVATKNDRLVYVEVNGDDGYYSNVSTPVEENTELIEMSKASLEMIQAEKEEKASKSNSTDLIPVLMLLY